MKACEVYDNALKLLGYSENNGNNQLTQRVMSRAVALFNIVYGDIRRICGMSIKRIKNLSEETELPEKAIDVLTCGVASYIAMSEGDDNAQAIWSAEYQTRRTTLSQISEISDVIPTPEGE